MVKKIRFVCVIFLFLFLLYWFRNESTSLFGKEKRIDYKVLIGADKKTVLKQKNTDLLVIDAEYFSKKEITKLRKQGIKKIFSYFNIGSIENFRKDYDCYKHLKLGDYENWEEEIWIDVSDKKWQKRLFKIADTYRKKGISGLFIDNTDVYYHFPREEIYGALFKIVKKLKKQGMTLMINGGDHFIKEMIKRKEGEKMIYGINQETVFTKIDFNKKAYGRNEKKNRKFFQDYVKLCSKYGMKIYLLEYGAENELKREIKDYCRKNKFYYTIADSLELDR